MLSASSLLTRVPDVWHIAVLPLVNGLGLMLLLYCLMRYWPTLRTSLACPGEPPVGQRTMLATSVAMSVAFAIGFAAIQHHGSVASTLRYMGLTLLWCAPTVYVHAAYGSWLFGKLAAARFGLGISLFLSIVVCNRIAGMLVYGIH